MSVEIYLANGQKRIEAVQAVTSAQLGSTINIKGRTRSTDQNALLHAICQEVAKQMQWNGVKRNYLQWKILFVSGHAMATQEEVDLDRGLEGEVVNFRESTAKMTKARFNSLLEYIYSWCAQNGVVLSEDRGVQG